MKKFWKYFLIVVLLLIGLFVLAMAYLFFVPGSSFLGISYVSYNKEILSQTAKVEDVSKIVVNGNRYEIKVVETKTDVISASVKSNVFGYTLTKNKTLDISLTEEDGVVTIDVTEPHGFAFTSNAIVKVKIPEGTTLGELVINNNSAKTTVSSSAIKISQISVNTKSGNIGVVRNEYLNVLNLDLSKGYCELSESGEIDNNINVNIKMTSGTFDSTKAKINQLEVKESKRGVVLVGECKTFKQNTGTSGGRVEIEKAGSVIVTSASDTNFRIKDCKDASINLSESGNVYIENIQEYSTITTNRGGIRIKNSARNLVLESQDGAIVVENAQKAVNARTTYGSITIDFASDALDFKTDGVSRKAIVATNKGLVTVKGVDNITADLGQNGRANIELRKVAKQSSIVGQSGAINVKVADNEVFHLYAKADNYLRVNVLGIDSGYLGNEQKEIDVYPGTNEASWNALAENDKGELNIINHSGDVVITSQSLN